MPYVRAAAAVGTASAAMGAAAAGVAAGVAAAGVAAAAASTGGDVGTAVPATERATSAQLCYLTNVCGRKSSA